MIPCSPFCFELFFHLVKNKLKKLSSQKADHCFAIIDIIQQYLKSVCDVYSQQKAIRVRRAFDKQKLSRLEINLTAKNGSTLFSNQFGANGVKGDIKNKLLDKSFETKIDNDDGSNKKHEIAEFTVEEVQMFEEENLRLYQELNEVTEEARFVVFCFKYMYSMC